MVPDPITQAGQMGGDIGDDVDRVAGDQQDGVWGNAHDLADDGAEYLGVAAEQFGSGLAGFLGDAAGEDDHGGVDDVLVGAGADDGGACEGDGVGDVLGLGAGAGGVEVDQDEVRDDVLQDQREARGRAHHACPDDTDFHANPSLAGRWEECARWGFGCQWWRQFGEVSTRGQPAGCARSRSYKGIFRFC